jgi:hypothetical protein
MYFSLMTLTTVDNGDIAPISSEAWLIAVFATGVGVFFLAFQVARLVALYRAEDE